MMSLRPMARSVPPFTPLSTFLRSNSTASSSTPTPARPPPRAPVVPTTFSEKASPKNVHQRPEQIRGFPPTTKRPEWETARSTASSSNADPEAFNGPSRPRLMYERPRRRELPEIKNRVPIIVALTLLGLGAWGSFLLYATNAERLASSVMRSLQFHLRNSSEVAALLGRRVKLEEPWYILGDPWISGSVNTMQGRVDLSFRVTGDHDAGTIYFTSIRPSQADPWRIVRYKLITDSGETLRLEESIGKI